MEWNCPYTENMLSETKCIQIKRRMFPTCCIFIISLSKYAEWNCPHTENSQNKTVCMLRMECTKIRYLSEFEFKIENTLGD